MTREEKIEFILGAISSDAVLLNLIKTIITSRLPQLEDQIIDNLYGLLD